MKILFIALFCALAINSFAQEKTTTRIEQEQKLALVQSEIAELTEKIDRIQLRLDELTPQEIPASVADELTLMKNRLTSKKRVEYSIVAYLESLTEGTEANEQE